VKPRRPYLLRAMHEWISDSQCTPHVVVDAGVAGVEVPRQFVQDGKIVLNLSYTATAQLQLGNEELSFNGRFGGVSMQVRVPLAAVLAIYARETGQGMVFADEPETQPPDTPPEPGPREPAPKPAVGRAKLKVVK
jgi:stringent starvation protein B